MQSTTNIKTPKCVLKLLNSLACVLLLDVGYRNMYFPKVQKRTFNENENQFNFYTEHIQTVAFNSYTKALMVKYNGTTNKPFRQ